MTAREVWAHSSKHRQNQHALMARVVPRRLEERERRSGSSRKSTLGKRSVRPAQSHSDARLRTRDEWLNPPERFLGCGSVNVDVYRGSELHVSRLSQSFRTLRKVSLGTRQRQFVCERSKSMPTAGSQLVALANQDTSFPISDCQNLSVVVYYA